MHGSENVKFHYQPSPLPGTCPFPELAPSSPCLHIPLSEDPS